MKTFATNTAANTPRRSAGYYDSLTPRFYAGPNDCITPRFSAGVQSPRKQDFSPKQTAVLPDLKSLGLLSVMFWAEALLLINHLDPRLKAGQFRSSRQFIK
jgi:hypothetical protein